MNIEKQLWGKTPDGKEIFLYTIKNESGAYVKLSSVVLGPVTDYIYVTVGLRIYILKVRDGIDL